MVILPVVLSGGSGTRLWPVSRADYPKQLQRLVGASSLLQQTCGRLRDVAGVMDPLVVCGEDQRFLVAEQLREAGIEPKKIVLEPVPRSTAPALAVAALMAGDPENTVLVAMPADHYIPDQQAFADEVLRAAACAMDGAIMTLGIKPDRPHTGFGYIEVGEHLSSSPDAFKVRRFVEKPDESRANEYVAQGDFLWNAGIFVFRADVFLKEMDALTAGIVPVCKEALDLGREDLDFLRLDAGAFSKAPDISVDYAVMEKSMNVGVLPVSFMWSDIGGWPALWEVSDKDAEGNVVRGDVLLKDSSRNLIYADGRVVAAIGVDDIVVVDTPDALLVSSKIKADEVKDVVARLKAQGRVEAKGHLKVWRPWGFYERLSQGPRFQVKKIMVKPGGKLSLQKHHHRAEHWIIVNGTAVIQCGDETRLMGPDESVYIPLGAVHRLENPGIVPLELIEVQSGDYLGEDDIVRIEDVYKRLDCSF